MSDAERIGVLGAGAFGTALAIAQAQAGRQVTLWARNATQAAEMARLRENRTRLPGVKLPDGLAVTSNFVAAASAPVVLLALPTQTLRSVLEAHGAELPEGVMLVACSKGVELGTGLLPTQIAAEMVPQAQTAALTGPSFAIDIAQGKPTALTLATTADRAEALQAALSTRNLRLYRSDDPVGAQLGGALKNVIAIAAGITMGAGLGESARAALMTRGFTEITRFAESRNAQAATLWGLSGFGDLVLTCTSEKSRNFRHGLAIGGGQEPDIRQTVEGVMTAHAMAASADHDALPVTSMVSALLKGKVALPDAIERLLTRPLKHERD